MFKKKNTALPWDRDTLEPVLRSSICTGETAAGFLEKSSGRFHEIMLIRDQKDLDSFMARYGLDKVPRKTY